MQKHKIQENYSKHIHNHNTVCQQTQIDRNTEKHTQRPRYIANNRLHSDALHVLRPNNAGLLTLSGLRTGRLGYQAVQSDWPVEHDPGHALRRRRAVVEVAESGVLGGRFELDDGQCRDFAVSCRVLIARLAEARDLARVVDDAGDLVVTQVVEDVTRLVVERRHLLTLRTRTCTSTRYVHSSSDTAVQTENSRIILPVIGMLSAYVLLAVGL